MLKPRRLTGAEIERMTDIMAYGPLEAKEVDKGLLECGLIEEYDPTPDLPVAYIASEEAVNRGFYDKDGSILPHWEGRKVVRLTLEVEMDVDMDPGHMAYLLSRGVRETVNRQALADRLEGRAGVRMNGLTFSEDK
jgi:hypothetical protein